VNGDVRSETNEGAQRNGHNQVEQSEGVEHQRGSPSTSAARDQRCRSGGDDVADAGRQCERSREVTLGHHDQEDPAHEPERVRPDQPSRRLGLGQDAAHGRKASCRQRGDEEGGERYAEPRCRLAVRLVVDVRPRERSADRDRACDEDRRR
jgi:hypothetical protein